MTTFYLIRHGATDALGNFLAGWRPGVHLNAAGQQHAARLVEYLERVPLDRIFSSPLERTLETAQPLAESRKLAIETCPDLGEMQFGEWTGRPMAEVNTDPRWRTWNTFRSGSQVPGGERMINAQGRVVGRLLDLRDRFPGQHVAIFSHADIIRAALAHFLGTPIDLFLRIEISPGSVSILELAEWGPRIVCVNSIPPPSERFP